MTKVNQQAFYISIYKHLVMLEAWALTIKAEVPIELSKDMKRLQHELQVEFTKA